MLNALIYKEWLKIRWAAVLTLALFLAVIVSIALNLSYVIRLSGANNVWNEFFIRGRLFFSNLQYVPIVTGAAIGAFQFFPEIIENRLKLTLHLPMHENKILLFMAAMGGTTIIIIYLLAMIGFSIVTLIYFPTKFLSSVLLTVSPWLIAGLITYFSTIMIFTERSWIKRIIFLLIAGSFVNLLVEPMRYEIFTPLVLPLIFLALLFSIVIVFSGHRFRKGVVR